MNQKIQIIKIKIKQLLLIIPKIKIKQKMRKIMKKKLKLKNKIMIIGFVKNVEFKMKIHLNIVLIVMLQEIKIL